MATKSFFLVAIVALCVFQTHGAKLKREEPPTQLEELSKQATAFLDNLGTQFNQVVNAKDGKELQSIIQTNTNTFVTQVAELTKSLQAQVGSATGDVSTVLGSVVAKLNETVTNLQKENPEMAAKAKEFEQQLQDGFKTVVAEADKVTKALGENTKGMQEDIAVLTKKAYDQVLATAKNLQEQVHQAANKA